jgi:hypothetical protein
MKPKSIIVLLVFILSVSALFITSCDNRTLEPEEYSIDSIYATPDTIYADGDDNTYAEVIAVILDEDGYPASGVDVIFTTTKGRITGKVSTDTDGVAKAILKDNGETAVATVKATVGSRSESITVTFTEAPSYHIAWIRAEPDTIYADNNVTYSEIKVKIEDNNNFAVPDQTVYFRALAQGTGETIGGILANITTDDTGVATSTFWDEGDIGTAVIDAFISGDQASVNVTIEDVPPITSLDLDVDADNLNVGESTNLRAFAENSLGIVPDGTIIVFSTTRGVFTDVEGNHIGSHVQIETSNGTALTYFNAGQRSGIATITASLSDMQDSQDIQIRPGAPQYIILSPSESSIEANSNEDVLITAEVEDSYHNPVSNGTGVSFSTDLGTVSPIGYTNSDGVATTTFSPGSIAGLATIQAVADSAQASTVIAITSNDVYSVGFQFQQQVEIQVQGTGGNESFQFRVNLYDVNGNLIDFPQEVFFKFVYAPNGTNINNQVYYPSPDSVSAMSSNGQASCSVSSGMESGIVALKAYTYDQNGNEKSATKSNIVIQSGPPAEVSISNPGHDSATNVGGGQWEMEIGAMITDIYGNGVGYGTAVSFSLDNNPNWAYIDPAAYVGNENADGDSLSGTAFTKLTFDGKFTNETVYIKVDVVGEDGLIEFPPISLVLKGQYLNLDMLATPQHIDWVSAADPTTQSVDVIVEVYDQQTNPIANQNLYIFSDYGVPTNGSYYYQTDENGVLELEWDFRRWEVPEPQDQAVSISATITAQILGPGTSESVTVILRRYP